MRRIHTGQSRVAIGGELEKALTGERSSGQAEILELAS